MPLLSSLLAWIATKFFGVFVFAFGAKWGTRLAAATALAVGYVACVAYWAGMVGPWLAGVFSTSYGAVLGLLFPPVSGTVLAALATYWVCVAVQSYTKTLLQALVK